MSREKKNKTIEELSEIYLNKKVILFIRYNNLSVGFIDDLRTALRSSESKFRIVKNNLSRIAFTRNSLVHDKNFFIKPIAIGYSDNPLEAIKTIFEFSKKNANLDMFSGLLDKVILSKEDLIRLSKIASLDVVRLKILHSLRYPARRVLLSIQSPLYRILHLLNNFSNIKR